jgi:hypothetical protein
MKDPGFQPADPRPMEAPRERRPRHFPRSGRLLLVAVLLFMAFVGFTGFFAGVVMLGVTQERAWGWPALGCLAGFALARALVFVLADALTCPLCHGTVMKERRCRKHDDAFRLWPLSYRASAVLSVLGRGMFRCMYCGTLWRLGRKRRE